MFIFVYFYHLVDCFCSMLGYSLAIYLASYMSCLPSSIPLRIPLSLHLLVGKCCSTFFIGLSTYRSTVSFLRHPDLNPFLLFSFHSLEVLVLYIFHQQVSVIYSFLVYFSLILLLFLPPYRFPLLIPFLWLLHPSEHSRSHLYN